MQQDGRKCDPAGMVVEVWREGRATNRLQHWHCDGVMHDMLMKLMKGSWCVPSNKA